MKKQSKIEKYIIDKIGEKYLDEYNVFDRNNKTAYYVYLLQREKYGLKDNHMTPTEWYITKKERELNTSFDEIARQLNISAFAVKEAYKSAINKIKEIIKNNPKYKEWKEMLQ